MISRAIETRPGDRDDSRRSARITNRGETVRGEIPADRGMIRFQAPVLARNKRRTRRITVLNALPMNSPGIRVYQRSGRVSNPKKNQLFFHSASSVHRDVLYTILHFSFIPHSAATPFLTHTCVINSSLKHSIKIPHGLAGKRRDIARRLLFSSYFFPVRRFHSAIRAPSI